MSRLRSIKVQGTRDRGFSLVELLVVIGVVSVLLALLAPALSSARESARAATCQANLRQVFIICRLYADSNRGRGPAIGQPYTALPNWALVVQEAAGLSGVSASDFYSTRSVLVCPSAEAAYRRGMMRTYAMNGTGHAGLIGESGQADPDNYDEPLTISTGNVRPVAINLDAVERPESLPLLVDSADAAATTSDAPPATRTASVIDFRQPLHVEFRLGRFHGSASRPGGSTPRKTVQAANLDGSARSVLDVPVSWRKPLP